MGEQAPYLLSGANFGGSILQARGQQQLGDASAQAARYNASLDEQEGYESEARIRREGARYLSRRHVAGLKTGFGADRTTLAAAAADAFEIERDALYARRYGQQSAKLQRNAASTYEQHGKSQALGTILSGAGQAGSIFYGLSRPRAR